MSELIQTCTASPTLSDILSATDTLDNIASKLEVLFMTMNDHRTLDTQSCNGVQIILKEIITEISETQNVLEAISLNSTA